MEEQFPLLYHVALNIGLPIVTLFAGWFGQAWKSKAQKKADDLDNTQQIINMQREYIERQQKELERFSEQNDRLEEKLDDKNEAIRQANKCEHVKNGGTCIVLEHVDKSVRKNCGDCKFNTDSGHVDG